ncbi:MAG: hypothetical protein HQL87_17620 [Magnetococcales bacterium]|nr:hypothetical protein [Magnetococcales bacterium]
MNIAHELGLPDFLSKTDIHAPTLELNYYGAAKLVADALGIANPPVSYVSWTHGWRHDVVHANQLACDSHMWLDRQTNQKVIIPARKKTPYLVANQAHETLLRENGFPDTRAVGLPFCYVAPDPTVKKMPGSLLVMPSHIMLNMEVSRAPDEIEYLEYIRSIAAPFTRVVFCVNLTCAASGLWINNLEKYGFDYVFGAAMMDQLALVRMRKIFDSFEYMTSNGIGSHFLYAGLCGLKVSLSGPLDQFPLDICKNEPLWENPVEREKLIFSAHLSQHDHLRKTYPWLYVAEPKEGKTCVEWAKREIGFHHKVSFHELARLFGWLPRHESQPEPFLDTVLRLDAPERVAELVQFVQSVPYNPSAMLGAVVNLLASQRLRPAYILSMLLAQGGDYNAAMSFALSMGGHVYHNAEEVARGMAGLPSFVDALSVEDLARFQTIIVLPLILPLLSTAIEQADDRPIQQLLMIVRAVVPALRLLPEAGGAEGGNQMVQILRNMLR